MKAIFIVYNQALTEKVEYILDRLKIRGYSQWPTMMGRGTNDGEPRMGTHTWPEMNSGTLTIVDDDIVDTVLEKVNALNNINTDVGIRAFVWDVNKTI